MSDNARLDQLEQRLTAAENALAGRIKTSAEWIADQIAVQETEKTAHQVLLRINTRQISLKVAQPGTEDRIKSLTENLARIDIALDELYKARDEMANPEQQSATANNPATEAPAPNGRVKEGTKA